MQTPQHDTLALHRDEHRAICEFLEWLSGVGRFVGEWNDAGRAEPLTSRELIAEFFGIDEEAFEAEKEAMLQQMRESNQK